MEFGTNMPFDLMDALHPQPSRGKKQRRHLVESNGHDGDDDDAVDKDIIEITEDGEEALPDKNSTEEATPGDKCKVKTLYEGPPKCSCCINWVEEYPQDLRENLEQSAESRSHALVLRKSKKHDGGGDERSLELHSIVVRSAHMKAMLRRVFKDYAGVTPELKKVTFDKPFTPFFHRWQEFGEAVADPPSDDEVAQAHWQLLYDTVRAELAETITKSQDLIDHGVMTMELVWTLFKPHDIVYTCGPLGVQALKVTSSEYSKDCNGAPIYQVQGTHVDFDGKKLGFAGAVRSIQLFQGTKKITELSVYPIQYHETSDILREELIARGKVFEAHAGIHVKEYNHSAIEEVDNMFRRREDVVMVNDRIVIDAAAFQEAALEGPMQLSSRDKKLSTEKLTEEELLLCSPCFRGFALRTKRWMRFRVDAVVDIEWRPKAFDRLVLAPSRKEMILALLEGQLQDLDAFADLIPGKGQSVVILLSGSPGTGKTLTAESVADTVKAPLYSATAGELGSDARDVEANLGSILENAARWNAVLLLDEADIFLERRTTADLERNKLVTIFLRMLEYYKGVLFLTTNRAESFDPAFLSRIHMHVLYPELDAQARLSVWQNFLQSADGESSISADQMVELAAKELNGRNIRNVVKMARLLAKRADKALSFDHLTTAIDVASRF